MRLRDCSLVLGAVPFAALAVLLGAGWLGAIALVAWLAIAAHTLVFAGRPRRAVAAAAAPAPRSTAPVELATALDRLDVAAAAINDRLRASRCEALSRSIALFSDHPGGLAGFLASDRGAPLPGYLAALASALVDENARLRDDIAALRDEVARLRTAVAGEPADAPARAALRAA